MIRQLPPSIQSQIRSGVAITSITQCVEELLLNAVDANSRCIAIRIDLSCFQIQVVDNGTGIAADQLDKIGQRYSTSKCQTIEDLESLKHFGYRGEALASIRDVSYILEISSRARCSAQTYCKIFQQGKSLDVIESKVHRPSPGTTITVHNLFYNLPVRQKSISATLEMESICHRVEALALMQPALSITLRNDSTGSVLIQTHKTNSPLVTFSYLFNHSKTQNLVSVSKSVGHFCIKGYISKESHYRKNLQFIYVNKRLILKTQLHKLVNQILKKSLIVRQRQALDVGEKLSPSKQADKYPVFVLNIQCPLDAYDITFDPRKTMVEFVNWDILSSGVEEMCKEFLCKENLLTVDCLFSEKINEKESLNQEMHSNENMYKLSMNYEQTAFDKIDEEMFDNIRCRGLKSCPIKRLFDKNNSIENVDFEQPTINKVIKTEDVSSGEMPVSSENTNFQNNSACSSASISSLSDSPTKQTNISVNQDISCASKSLIHQNLSKENVLENEKLSTNMAETCFSDCETHFFEQDADSSQEDSLKSNYINKKLNNKNIKKILMADDVQNKTICPKYKTDSIPSFHCEKDRNSSSKNVPSFFNLEHNEKLPAKHKVCSRTKNSLPSGKSILSMFRNYKKNTKELSSPKPSQSTRSILDQFRAPQHKREIKESVVETLKPNIKNLYSFEKNLENAGLTTKASEVIPSKEQLNFFRNPLPEMSVYPYCDNSSVPENEMLQKLLIQKSSGNTITSKLCKLYKNSGMKNCSPSQNKILLTPVSAAEHKERDEFDEKKQKENKESCFENQKMKLDVNNLNSKLDECYNENSQKVKMKESFTSLQEYNSRKSMPSLDPVLNFVSMMDHKSNPDDLDCQQNVERSENLAQNKRQFLSSSVFLQTLDTINLKNTKRTRTQVKESDRKNYTNFDFACLHPFTGNKQNEFNHFGNNTHTKRTSHHGTYGNIYFPSCSSEENIKDFCDGLSESNHLSKSKTLSNSTCSDQDKNVSVESCSIEAEQTNKSFFGDTFGERPLLSLDFTSVKNSVSPPNCQDTISKADFEQNILYNNSEEEVEVGTLKKNNDKTSLVTTKMDSNLENEKSCSVMEIQGNTSELEENIEENEQIVTRPISELYFNEDKLLKGGKHLFKNETVNPNVSFNKTDGSIEEKCLAFHSSSVSLLEPSISFEARKYTKLFQVKESNQKLRDNSEYLHESPKILSDNTGNLNKYPKMSPETSKSLSDSPQISSKVCEMLIDSSEKYEETSGKPSEIRNHSPEIWNEISYALSDTHETLKNILKLTKFPIDTSVASNHNTHKIMNPTPEATISVCKEPRNNTNSQCNQYNIVSNEAVTDTFEHVLHTSSISNRGSDTDPGPIDDKSLPSSSILLSTKSSSSILETFIQKNYSQENTSISTIENSSLRKTDNFIPSLEDQTFSSPLHRSSFKSSSDYPDLVMNNLINICEDLKSNKNSQQLQAECTFKTLSSPKKLIEIQYSKEKARNSQTHNETKMQQHFPSSFSNDLHINQDIEKSSKTSNLKSPSTKSPKTCVLRESSVFSNSEEISHNLMPSKSFPTLSLDSHNIQLTNNFDCLENSETIRLQDLIPVNRTPFQASTSTAFNLNLNESEQNDKNLFESKPNEKLEMECIENVFVKTDERDFENINAGLADNDEDKGNEPIIVDDNETDLTLKLWRNWKNPVFHVSKTDVLDIWANNPGQQKLYRVTHSCQFTKTMLSKMQTIGQVDNKFIACIVKSQDEKSGIPDHLLMIDQHAAHERVRLEQLTADMYQVENSEGSEKLAVKFSHIVPPWSFSLSDKEMRIVSSFLDEFAKIGLQLNVHEENNTIEIHTAPSCIMAREASERKHNRNTVAMELVQALIKEEIELLHDTRGAHSTLPKTIHNLLCSQACHGAIKFNDPLTLVECQNLLRMLLKCKLPFQCAHGRPSVIPLLNLQHLKKVLTKSESPRINLKKLKKQMEEQDNMDL